MLKIPAPAHSLRFDENNQEFSIIGALRPQHNDDIRNCIEMLRDAVSRVRGTLYINVKRLVRLNNIAFRALASSVVAAATERSDLKLVIVTSSVVGWATKKFRPLMQVNPRIVVEEYDADFYPGQAFVEDSDIIGLLRTQTNMTWRHEQGILPRHGLKPGMAVADICCGIGDFAVLLHKAFAPGRMVALDHSRPSLDYARGVAEEFGISGIEYVYGDASEMLLEDNQFDFVTCRHALQVFDRPELILKELFRICKPGGRVYVTNEKNSHCLGEPRGETGAVIESVSPSKPAADAGLQTGDVIVSVNQAPVKSAKEARTAIAEAGKSGRKSVLLLVQRGDEQTFVAVPFSVG